jgi:hypothetical protein
MLAGAKGLPEPLRQELVAEQPRVLAEGLTGSVTVRGYRGPDLQRKGAGRSVSSFAKWAVAGSVAVTPRRFVLWAGHHKHIDLPLDHPLMGRIEVGLDRPDRIRFGYDAGMVDQSRTGRVEVRLGTEQAPAILAALGRYPG